MINNNYPIQKYNVNVKFPRHTIPVVYTTLFSALLILKMIGVMDITMATVIFSPLAIMVGLLVLIQIFAFAYILIKIHRDE